MITVDKILSKDRETRNLQINTMIIFVLRGAGILCNFALIPLTLGYLTRMNYGVWITLTSIISWISDVGLGNGLRNKLSQAIELRKINLAKQYVSTSYILFTAIVTIIFAIISIIIPLLNWDMILKTDMPHKDIITLVYFVAFSFCLRMVLDLPGIIVTALHQPFIKACVEFVINLTTLVAVFFLTFSDKKTLFFFGSVVSLIPVLVLLGFTLFIFRGGSEYNFLKPSLKNFRREHLRPLFSLGSQFFLLQLAYIMVFSTANIMITQLFSPLEVTNYNIAYKYLGAITLVFNLTMTPYWSSFTSAFFGNRLEWIKGAFKKLVIFWLLQIIVVCLFIYFANDVYAIWVGEDIIIPKSLNIWLGIFIIISNWNSIYLFFLNGTSKIRIQLYHAFFTCVINVPLTYFLATCTDLNVSSIVVSNCLCLFLCSIWAPIQCYKLVSKSAVGIWDK